MFQESRDTLSQASVLSDDILSFWVGEARGFLPSLEGSHRGDRSHRGKMFGSGPATC